MGVPLAEGTPTVPAEYVLPAGYGNTGVVRSVEGDGTALAIPSPRLVTQPLPSLLLRRVCLVSTHRTRVIRQVQERGVPFPR